MAKNIYSKPYSYYQNPHPGAVPYSPRHAKKALEPEQHIQTIANEDQHFQMIDMLELGISVGRVLVS